MSVKSALWAWSLADRLKIVEWAFGKRMTPAERLRKHQRALEKTQRELDRERVKLENQEKKLVQDIKKNAKNGQMGAVRIQAKDLVRTRRWGRPRGIPLYLLNVLKVYREVLFYADTATGYFFEDTSKHFWASDRSVDWIGSTDTFSDSSKQRANDAINEGSNITAQRNEPANESSGLAKDRYGV